jgi:hypothetical protein
LGGSSSPETRPVSDLSLDELRAHFAPRATIPRADVAQLSGRAAALRGRYNEQVQRAKIQFVDPRLKLVSCEPLLERARATVAVSQLTYEALCSLDVALGEPTRPAVAPQVIEDALAWNDGELDRIARHLQLLNAADSQGAWLDALLPQLETSSHISAFDWTMLAREVVITARRDADSPVLTGLDLKPYLVEVGQVRHPEIVGCGVEAASLIARIATGPAGRGLDAELLTIAALTQDCGLVLSQTAAAKNVSERRLRDLQLRALHPSVGAALLAGLVEFSAELPGLVSQHHRRLNDPRTKPEFRARNQNRHSRLLASVVRWSELVEGKRAAPAEAARLLVLETLRGDWDRQSAREVLGALGLSAEFGQLDEAARPQLTYENRDDARRRLDPPEARWPQINVPLADSELRPGSREAEHVGRAAS